MLPILQDGHHAYVDYYNDIFTSRDNSRLLIPGR